MRDLHRMIHCLFSSLSPFHSLNHSLSLSISVSVLHVLLSALSKLPTNTHTHHTHTHSQPDTVYALRLSCTLFRTFPTLSCLPASLSLSLTLSPSAPLIKALSLSRSSISSCRRLSLSRLLGLRAVLRFHFGLFFIHLQRVY